ncbi:MAG: SH3 domain-containing protein [Chloroflexi bacterium]|nr:SH3 domain-containing protein [Chloroflexota bacterium]
MTINQTPEEFIPAELPSHIDETRRRRTRRLIIPSGKTERALYVNEIAKRLVPGLDFYLFSMLCGLVLGGAILLDHPAIYILAALLAPFMAPLVGLGLSTAVGSFGFFIRSLASLLIASVFIFAGGALSGWLSKLFIDLPVTQARFHTSFTLPDLILLTIGTALAIYLTVRVPKQRSLVASVALAYEIYLPIGVAGFGLTSGTQGFFPQALQFSGVNILLVILIGTIVLAFLRLRPFTFFGYVLTAVLLGGAIYTIVMTSAIGSALQVRIDPVRSALPSQAVNSSIPTPSATLPPPSAQVSVMPAESTPTNTLVPTHTPTVTSTPKPTTVWAKINSTTSNGINIRKSPGFDGEVLVGLQNGELVQVLEDSQMVDNMTWVHVIFNNNQEGWIVRGLLLTATPAPDW